MVDFNIEWPAAVDSLWSGSGGVGLPINSGFVACTMQWDFYTRFLVSASAPVWTVVLLLPLVFLVNVIKRCRGTNRSAFSGLPTAVIMLWFLIYPTIVSRRAGGVACFRCADNHVATQVREMVRAVNCTVPIYGKR